MEKQTWAQCLSTTELISELKTRAEDQRNEAIMAVGRDEHCSLHAGEIHEDLADLLDETAIRMELVGLNYFKWVAKSIKERGEHYRALHAIAEELGVDLKGVFGFKDVRDAISKHIAQRKG